MKRISKKTNIPSGKECIGQGVEFIENCLKEVGVKPKLLIRTVLLCEEVLSQFAENTDEKTNITIHVKKSFGDASVTISAKGSNFDLYSESDDEESAIRSIYLRSQNDRLKFYRINNSSYARIFAGTKDKSVIVNTVIALLLGILFGAVLKFLVPENLTNAVIDYALDPVKAMFMSALKIIIAPVVFFSIVSSVSQFKEMTELGRIGVKVIGTYFLTTMFAIVIALMVFTLVNPKTDGIADAQIETEVDVDLENVDTSLLGTIVNIVPSNFVQPFVESNTLQIIFLAVVCGIAVGMVGDYAAGLRMFFEAFNSLFVSITSIFIKCMPVAVLCSVSIMMATLNIDTLLSLLNYVVTFIITISCMLCVYGMLVFVFGRVNPFTFYKKNWEGMLSSFTLCSSSACVPINMKICTDKMGISPKVSSFSIPLGATINMDGATIFSMITGLFFAKAYGIELSGSTMLSLIITIVILSVAAPGVPGVAMVTLSIVFAAAGVPIEAVGLLIGILPFIDMFTTMNNTTGDVAASLIVARSEKLLDLEIYNGKIAE